MIAVYLISKRALSPEVFTQMAPDWHSYTDTHISQHPQLYQYLGGPRDPDPRNTFNTDTAALVNQAHAWLAENAEYLVTRRCQE